MDNNKINDLTVFLKEYNIELLYDSTSVDTRKFILVYTLNLDPQDIVDLQLVEGFTFMKKLYNNDPLLKSTGSFMSQTFGVKLDLNFDNVMRKACKITTAISGGFPYHDQYKIIRGEITPTSEFTNLQCSIHVKLLGTSLREFLAITNTEIAVLISRFRELAALFTLEAIFPMKKSYDLLETSALEYLYNNSTKI